MSRKWRYWERDTGNEIQGTRYRERDTGNEIQGTRYRERDTGNEIQVGSNRHHLINPPEDSNCPEAVKKIRVKVKKPEAKKSFIYQREKIWART